MSMSKLMFTILMAVIVISGALTVIQIWVPIVSWDVYLKIMISAGVIATVLGLIYLLQSDFSYNKKLKDEDYLD